MIALCINRSHLTMKLTDNEIRDINRYLEEGKVAGKEVEKKTGIKVVTSENYLNITGKIENEKLRAEQ